MYSHVHKVTNTFESRKPNLTLIWIGLFKNRPISGNDDFFFFLKSLKIIKLEHLNKLFFGYTIIISLDDEAHREVYSQDKRHFKTAAASIESSSHSFSHPKATMRCVTIRHNG